MSSEQNEQPSAAPLCANNCGFYGNPANRNLCSKCYREALKTETAQPPCRIEVNASPISEAPVVPMDDTIINEESNPTIPESHIPESHITDIPKLSESPPSSIPAQVNTSRCYKCQKKVGLLGFQCRCGFFYCGEHRYADTHECQFDYKTFERAQIKKHNERVIADKVNKI